MEGVGAEISLPGNDTVNPAFGHAARSLLAGPPGETASSTQLAARAAQQCDRFATHLARLLGDSGVQLMLKRSILRVAPQFAWLPTDMSLDSATSTLRDAMAKQDPASITEAFVAVLTAFVGLLERLIGEGLVERLLDEVWPSIFTHAAKDTP